MSTVFSGTDISTLQEEGNERNCFVSLIVNNEGSYNAAITRKIQSKNEVTIKNLGKTYEFFGNGTIQTEECSSVGNPQLIEKEVIEYFMLEVERETVDNPLDYLDKRFDDIKREKDAQSAKRTSDDFYWSKYDTSFSSKSREHQNTENKQLQIWGEGKKEEEETINYAEPLLDSNTVKLMATKIVVCSLSDEVSTIDLEDWVGLCMEEEYEKMFKTEESFNAWCDFVIDYLMAEYSYIFNNPYDAEVGQANLAKALIDELSPFKYQNNYIQSYIDTLNLF